MLTKETKPKFRLYLMTFWLVILFIGKIIHTGTTEARYGYNFDDTTPEVQWLGNSKIEGNMENPVIYQGEVGKSNFFGTTVSNLGDINGDGFVDFGISATDQRSKQTPGYFYIKLGETNLDASFDYILEGELMGDCFGFNSGYGGDFNGDGFSDVIVGAYNSKVGTNTSETGRNYLYFGNSEFDTQVDIIFDSPQAGSRGGHNMNFVGDLNNDGYDDLVNGYPLEDSQNGKVRVFFGSSNPDKISDLTISIDEINHGFGNRINGLGDINNDGYDDFVVGTAEINNLIVFFRGSYVFFGGNPMDNVPDLILSGGHFPGAAGDVNGDGYQDILTGNCLAAGGLVNVYFGSAENEWDNIADITLTGYYSSGLFGWSFTVDDLNKDSFADVIIGSLYDSENIYRGGGVYIYLGKPDFNNVEDWVIFGNNSNGEFGRHVQIISDANNDGWKELLVGATGEEKAYLYTNIGKKFSKSEISEPLSNTTSESLITPSSDPSTKITSDSLITPPEVIPGLEATNGLMGVLFLALAILMRKRKRE